MNNSRKIVSLMQDEYGSKTKKEFFGFGPPKVKGTKKYIIEKKKKIENELINAKKK